MHLLMQLLEECNSSSCYFLSFFPWVGDSGDFMYVYMYIYKCIVRYITVYAHTWSLWLTFYRFAGPGVGTDTVDSSRKKKDEISIWGSLLRSSRYHCPVCGIPTTPLPRYQSTFSLQCHRALLAHGATEAQDQVAHGLDSHMGPWVNDSLGPMQWAHGP